jgi:DNA-binding transcriptional LysR family regulator
LSRVAVRVTSDHRPAIVGASAYFESPPKLKSSRGPLNHCCINFRHDREAIHRWEFDKGKASVTVAVNGPLVIDDVRLVIRAGLDDVGVAYIGEDLAAPHMEREALVRILESWCQRFPRSFSIIRVGGSSCRR